jgi:uncharacterized membrane protein
LSIFTLVMLPLGVWFAHGHRVIDHRRVMIGIFSGALVVAGLFTLVPGRIMHAVIFWPLNEALSVPASALPFAL